MPHPGRLASNPTPGPGSANVSHFPLPITGLGVDRYLGRMSASHSVGTGDSGGHSKGPGVRENGEELRGRKEEEENKILEERRGPVVERVMGPGTSFPLLPPPSPEGAWPDPPRSRAGLVILGGAGSGQVQASAFLWTIQPFRVSSSGELLGSNR